MAMNSLAAADISAAQKELTENFKHIAQEMGQNIQEVSRLAAEALQGSMGQIKTGAKTAYRKGLDKAEDAEKSMEVQVQSHPLLAILIAAFAGFIIGLFLMGRSEEEQE